MEKRRSASFGSYAGLTMGTWDTRLWSMKVREQSPSTCLGVPNRRPVGLIRPKRGVLFVYVSIIFCLLHATVTQLLLDSVDL